MRHFGIILACCGAFFFSFGEVITLTGRVVDSSSSQNPIPNVTVSLKNQGSSTITNPSGQFSINFTQTSTSRMPGKMHPALQLTGSKLEFSSLAKEPVRIDVYNLHGKILSTLFDQTVEPGTHSLSLSVLMEMKPSFSFCIFKIRKGHENISAAFIPSAQGKGIFIDRVRSFPPSGLAFYSASAAAQDSLIVYRMGFSMRSLPLTGSTTPSLGDILLSRTAEEIAVERKADSLLKIMTLAQKAAQMVQAQINKVTDEQITAGGYGSVFNGGEQPVTPNNKDSWATRIDKIQIAMLSSSPLKIPIIYGIDAVHGNAKVGGATVFPHSIGLGCTRDTALMRKAGEITAAECAAVGIHLTFTPSLSVVRNEKWGRTYEAFGETPEINTIMGSAFIRGLQGNGDLSKNGAILGCAKHFLGDGATTDGKNGGDATIGDATMRAVHLPPYMAAVRENIAAVMPSYSTWAHDNKAWKQSLDTYTLTTILKQELGFDGFCLSDYNAIPRACYGETGNYTLDCVAQSINAGMDMAMIAGDNAVVSLFVNAIVDGVSQQKIQQSRVDDAVKRILRVKFRMHLWDRPKADASLRGQMGSSEHRAVARECVRKSLVLLKNDGNALPLKKNNEKIVVVGPWANSLGLQCGGWTLNWQGNPKYNSDSLPGGTTILQGLRNIGGTNVTYDSLGNNLSTADKIVLFIGELPYAEEWGDDGFSESDKLWANPDWGGLFKNHTISISMNNLYSYDLFTKCANSGKPVVCILLSGRPMIITSDDFSKCKAFVAAWLPGSEGQGIAEVLFNDYNFTGKLTHTWPASADQIPINAGTSYSDEQHGNQGTPLKAIDFGLQY